VSNFQVTLVGESFGGCLALRVAAAAPGLVARLVLVNPATCFGQSLFGISSLVAATGLLSIFPKPLYEVCWRALRGVCATSTGHNAASACAWWCHFTISIHPDAPLFQPSAHGQQCRQTQPPLPDTTARCSGAADGAGGADTLHGGPGTGGARDSAGGALDDAHECACLLPGAYLIYI
jgi:pimeloyl-ACP methyl ester carboxylesterase